MEGAIDAAGMLAEGAATARAVEPGHGEARESAHGICANCGIALTGPYCAACGQNSHVHRSLSGFGHDLLHGVFHFEGKIWDTLPLLFWNPGQLTRRYIAGERAKFVSPMALFLFSIFVMFAVFSFGGSSHSPSIKPQDNAEYIEGVRESLAEQQTALKALEAEIAEMPENDPGRRALEASVREAKAEINVLAYMDNKPAPYPEVMQDGETRGGAFMRGMRDALGEGAENQDLLLYKMKTNGYKFSWLLIPLSLPFMWLVTLGVRGHPMYDHAIFVTYSISFMSLLVIVLVLLEMIGISGGILWPAGAVYALFHLYRHLRHSYGRSRIGTVFRLMLLLISIGIVAILFMAFLVATGLM